MGRFLLAGDHLVYGRFAGHRIGDGHFGRLVVEVVDLLVVGRLGMDEGPTDTDQILGLVLGDYSIGHRIGKVEGLILIGIYIYFILANIDVLPKP